MHRKWRWFKKKLTNDKFNDMNERSGLYNEDRFNNTVFHEAIALKDKKFESHI
jgi:hypothetical protein